MKRLTFACAAFCAFGVADAAICDAPPEPDLDFAPSDVTRDDIMAARDTVIEYQTALGAYRDCLEKNRSALTGYQADRLYEVSVEDEKKAVAQVKSMVVAFKRRRQAAL